MTATENCKSFFTQNIFTRRTPLVASAFIKAMHPKSEILPDPESVKRVLAAGWLGQLKIHGHRVQLHICADSKKEIIAYNRQGKKHALELSKPMVSEIRRLFTPAKGWNVVDAEWLKGKEKIFVFDFLKKEDKVLRLKTFPERWSLLPRNFISPHISILPILRDLPTCLKLLKQDKPHIEGLVFKSATSAGFSDTSIVRCRIRK